MLPADVPAWERVARERALALVLAASSLCAKLPLELCHAIADVLLQRPGWFSFAAPLARTSLPSPDDTIEAASVARRLATLTLEAAGDPSDGVVQTAIPLEVEEHVARCRAHAPCVAELHERLVRGDRWLQPISMRPIPHQVSQIESHSRVGSDHTTIFTRSPIPVSAEPEDGERAMAVYLMA
mmetsp:Transcript_1688/g.3864  ORF Transcript_1688/g.3864 Transcript_1688/m.3864 type:complete len:183 (-) Transcript_1688:292-840(-)